MAANADRRSQQTRSRQLKCSTRRGFVKTVVGGAGLAMLPGKAIGQEAKSAQKTRWKPRDPDSTEHIEYDYQSPYEYGVMQGSPVPEQLRVDMRFKTNTFYDADQQRLIWAQQNFDSLARTVRLKRGTESISPLHPLPLTFEGFSVKDADGGSVAFDDWLRGNMVDGIMGLYVSEEYGPVIAIERYRHGLGISTPHIAWSLSKSLSAPVVFHAFAQGKLAPDTLLTDFLPEFAESGLAGATVGDVFHMLSATEPTLFNTWSAATRFYEHDMEKLRPYLPDEKLPDGQVDFFAKAVKRIPGRRHGAYWDYKNQDAFSAVEAACRALGGEFADVYSRYVYAKVGAQQDATICVDQHGSAMTQLGISLCLRDLARIALQYLPRYKGTAFPSDMVENLMRRKDFKVAEGPSHHYFRRYSDLDWLKESGGYRGLHWKYPQSPRSDCGIIGGGWRGQYLHAYPGLNVAIVQFASNRDDVNAIAPSGPSFLAMAKFISAEYQNIGL